MQQVGAYGAVQSTLHAFQWLAKGAPDARRYSYASSPAFNNFNRNAAAGAAEAGLSGAGAGADDGLTLEDLGFGEDPTTSTAYIATDIEYRLADLRLKAAVEGVDWSEAEDLGHAAVLSTVDVLKSFLAAFGEVLVDQNVVYALSVLEAAYGRSKASTSRQTFSLSMGNAPIFIMQRIVDLITPQDLEQSLDFVQESGSTATTMTDFKAPGAARACYLLRFDFPLLSPKTGKLVEILQRYSPEQKSFVSTYWSGIVFAQQRTTVLALASLLAHLPRTQAWLKTSPFMAQGIAVGGSAFMPDEQKAILDSFRAGKLNLLVSTSVAEEGIDVKSCQLVIRFDPAPTAQAFHQSRGRARAAGSQLIALVEHGNEEETAAVHEMAAYQHKMREAALQNVADLAQAENINLDEHENGDDDEIEELFDLDGSTTESNRAYVVASTGAKVDLHSAISVLQHYISQLPADEYMLLRPAWRLDYLGGDKSNATAGGVVGSAGIGIGSNGTGSSARYNIGSSFGPAAPTGTFQIRATVRLPSSSPLQTATGQLAMTKRMAKASAALEACRELHRLGALNDHLLPAGLYADDAEEEEEEEVDPAVAAVAGQAGVKRRRAGTIFDSISIKTVPPAGLSTPLPSQIEGKSVTLYGYGWQHQQQGAGEWFPLALLLPQPLPNLDCCSSGKTNAAKTSQWGDVVLLGEFQLDAAQLKLILQCNDIFKSTKGPWRSLSVYSSTGDSEQAPASTYALVPLRADFLKKSVSTIATTTATAPPSELDWEKIQRIVWLEEMSRSERSVLDLIRTMCT